MLGSSDRHRRSEASQLFGTVGLLFTLIGLLFAFGRSGFVVDRRRRVIRSWSKLFWLKGELESSLEPFSEVALVRRWNPSNVGAKWLFEVVLRSCDRKVEPIVIGARTTMRQTRVVLDRLATFLQLTAKDESKATTTA